jgi:hypothetical protein
MEGGGGSGGGGGGGGGSKDPPSQEEEDEQPIFLEPKSKRGGVFMVIVKEEGTTPDTEIKVKSKGPSQSLDLRAWLKDDLPHQPYVRHRVYSVKYYDHDRKGPASFTASTDADDLTDDNGGALPIIFVTIETLPPTFQSEKFLRNGAFRQTKDGASLPLGLRAVQENALLRLRDRLVHKKQQRFLVLLPTGVGKTTIMALAPFMVEARSVLVVVPSLILRDQTKAKFENYFGIAADMKTPQGGARRRFRHIFGRLAATKVDILLLSETTAHQHRDVTITNSQHMIQCKKTSGKKLSGRAKEYLDEHRPDLVIFDEGHHSVADSWKLIWAAAVAANETCKMVVVTATAMRANQQLSYTTTYGLKTSDNVYVSTRSEARAAGYIKPTLYEAVDRDGLAFNTPEWRAMIMTAAIEKLRSVRESCPGFPWRILAHVPNIVQAKALALEVNQLSHTKGWNLRAEAITGQATGARANASAIAALKDAFACDASLQVDDDGSEPRKVKGPLVDIGTYVRWSA